MKTNWGLKTKPANQLSFAENLERIKLFLGSLIADEFAID